MRQRVYWLNAFERASAEISDEIYLRLIDDLAMCYVRNMYQKQLETKVLTR